MKLRVLLLFSTISISLISIAQSYHPLVKENASWTIEYWYDFSPPSGHEVYKLFIEDDTTVNTLNYKFVYQNKWDSLSKIKNKNGIRLIREDTLSKKVFVIYLDGSIGNNDSIEWLLYDFSVQVGDTLIYDTLPLWYNNPGIYRCDSIDTIFIEGHARRRFYFTRNIPFGQDIWIEGIGSIQIGFFGPHFEEFESFYSISCYWDDELFWRNDTTRSCAVLTIGKISDVATEVKVFPVPVQNTLFISSLTGMHSYKILNLDGRIVKSGLIESEKQINFSSIQSGFYLLMIVNTTGERTVFKVVKE